MCRVDRLSDVLYSANLSAWLDNGWDYSSKSAETQYSNSLSLSISCPNSFLNLEISIQGVALPVAEQMKVLGVVLDQRLTFEEHATALAKSRNYHAQAIQHTRHLLTLDLAQTLACSLILSRIDYCNALLHGALASTINKL